MNHLQKIPILKYQNHLLLTLVNFMSCALNKDKIIKIPKFRDLCSDQTMYLDQEPMPYYMN